MAKVAKKRVVRAVVAAKGRAARAREVILGGAIRKKAAQVAATPRAMGARREALRAATAAFATIAGFAVRALAAMSN